MVAGLIFVTLYGFRAKLNALPGALLGSHSRCHVFLIRGYCCRGETVTLNVAAFSISVAEGSFIESIFKKRIYGAPVDGESLQNQTRCMFHLEVNLLF